MIPIEIGPVIISMVFPTLAKRIPPIMLAQTTTLIVILCDMRAEIINEDTILADIAKKTFIAPVLNPNPDCTGFPATMLLNLVGWKNVDAAKLKNTKKVPAIDRIIEIRLA